MALFNFPPNPAIGETYTVGSRTYIWNGSAWIIGPSPGSFTTVTGVTLVLTTTANAVSIYNGGALTVAGGAAVAGDLYVGGSIVGISTGTGGGIGAISGGTGTFARVVVTSGVQSYSTMTGALVVNGGMGLSGNLWLGGTLFSGGAPVLTTASFNETIADGVDIDITDIGGGVLEFNNISTLQSVSSRGNSTTFTVNILNTTSSTATNNGALVVAGGVGVGGRVNSESLRIADTIFDSTVQTVNNTLATVIDEFSFNEYRSAKYLVQVSEGTSSTHRCQVTELLTLVSNTGSVIVTEYGSVVTDTDLGNFDAMVTNAGYDTVVRLYFLAVDSTPKTVKVMRTAMAK